MARWSEERWEYVDGGYVRRRTPLVESDYSSMTKAQLSDELESRGLPKSGSKDELIARLEEADLEPVEA